MKRIVPERLMQGMILSVKGTKFFPSRMIQWMLDIQRRRDNRRGVSDLPKADRNHDAIVIYRKYPFWQGSVQMHPGWYVGDAEPPKAVLTPIEDYNADISKGKIDVRVGWPKDAEKEEGEKAAQRWVDMIHNTRYDFKAYPRMILKCLFGDWIKKAAGALWAWFCTESVRGAWRPWRDPWGKNTPTPFTTQKRFESGDIEDVTEQVCSSKECATH